MFDLFFPNSQSGLESSVIDVFELMWVWNQHSDWQVTFINTDSEIRGIEMWRMGFLELGGTQCKFRRWDPWELVPVYMELMR